MKEYRIGDFAKAMNVSTDFLKYYEENDILHPHKNEENNYRYYTINESRIVLLIRKLRAMNFSVNEIRDIIHNYNQDEIQVFLEHSEQECLNELEIIQSKMSYFNRLKTALELGKSTNNLLIEPYPAFYFIPHTDGDDYLEIDQSLEKKIMDNIIYVRECERFYLKDGEYNFQHGWIILEENLEHFQIDTSNLIYVPEQTTIEVYTTYTHHDIYQKEDDLTINKFQKALAKIEYHNFEISNDIYVDFIAFTHDDDTLTEYVLLHTTK